MLPDILKDVLAGTIILVLPAVWLLMKYPFKRKTSAQPIGRSALDFTSTLFTTPTPEPVSAPIWGFIERLPFCRRWAWKHIYTRSKITAGVRVQVNGESGMTFYWSREAGEAALCLYVVNLNPFPITVDRIIGALTVANSEVAEIQHMKKEQILATEDARLRVKVHTTEQHAKRINFLRKQDRRCGARLTMYLATPLGEVEHVVNVSTANVEFSNYNQLDAD